MKTKKTTYQRLKEEKARLLGDIRVMVVNPDSINATALRIKYKTEFQLEELIMFGDATKKDKPQGLMDFITKNK